MKSLLVAARVDPELWADRFRAALPSHETLTETANPASIAYVVVDRPPPELIPSLTGLEIVLSLNAGVEYLLTTANVPDGVPIVRMVDEGLTSGMTDWVLAQVLAWHRNLFDYAVDQSGGRWSPKPEALARDRIVTLLGAGALGRPILELLARFGFQARAWSRTPRGIAGVESFAGAEGFAPALAGADTLINLLPLTPETENLIDQVALARLAPGAFLINAGRGGTIVDGDLLAALDQGGLGGAALDVFRQEPLPADHPFWTHPRIRISPHVAAQTNPKTAVCAMVETIRRHERGEPLFNVVDRTRGY
jgi:glyoxylate/hydroxypyruvate reductase A